MHRIAEDVAERLDVIPAQFRVIVTRRPKYGCRACETADYPCAKLRRRCFSIASAVNR